MLQKNLVVEFLDGIVTRFGAPSTIISNNAKSFVGTHIFSWEIDHGIYLSCSSNYYPKGSGVAKSSNKKLIIIMERTIEDSQRKWHNKLKTSFWVDKTKPKREIMNSLFILLYRREAKPPISLEFPSLELGH